MERWKDRKMERQKDGNAERRKDKKMDSYSGEWGELVKERLG